MKHFRVLLVFMSIMALCACSTTYRIGQRFASASINKIIIGKTTQQEIVRLFGSPLKTGICNGNEIYIYSYQEIVFHEEGPFQTNYSVDKTGDSLVIEFDADKVVKGYHFNVPGQEPVILGFLMRTHKAQKDAQQNVHIQFRIN